MYLVLCYDVAGDSTRARLFRRVRGFLRPVQKSVFEGRVPEARVPALLESIDDLIDHATDTVRVYVLCASCRRSTTLAGTARAVPSEAEDVVV